MLTLVICQPHRVLDQYVNLRAWSERAHVRLKLAPPAPLKTRVFSQIYGRTFDALTPLSQVPKLLAESVQADPDQSGAYYCLVYAADVSRPEALCAHGRLRVRLAAGMDPQRARWWYFVRALDGQGWAADLSEPGDATQKIMDADREGSMKFTQRGLAFDFNDPSR